MDAWQHRAYSRDEAATFCGLPHVSQLDVLIHRERRVSALFSGKFGSQRRFSLKDVCILRVAFELERAGRSWLMALGQAFDALERPPEPDALLIAPAVVKRGCGLPRLVPDRDVPRLNFDRSTIVIPIGRIVAKISEEAARVWSP